MSTLPTGTAGQAVIDAARNFALTGEGFDALCRAIEAYETQPAMAAAAPADERADVKRTAFPEGCRSQECEDCKWAQREGVSLCDGCEELANRTAASPAAESVTDEQRSTINALIELTRATFIALDDSEEREGPDGREHVIDSANFDRISAALDRLEELPDDRPGYTLDAGGKAEWALRAILAAPQPAQADAPAEPREPVAMPAVTRALLLNVLWHHQGGSSEIGQPIRKLLGIGAHDHLTDEQLSEAKRIEAILDGGEPGAELPRFPVELRKMWSGSEVQRWLDERMKPRFKVLRNALEHIAKVARGSRSQSRRSRWIELRALGALNGSTEWRTVELPKNGESVRRRLEHTIAEREALIQALQKALAYWMPKVFDERSEHDAYLLVGYEGEAEESWGEKVQAELDRLNAIINTPQSGDFLRAVSTEAEHQRRRWGHHDASKEPGDWYRLVGYLANKALLACLSKDREKAEHHVITSAAALANWHRAVLGNMPAPAAPSPRPSYAWYDTGPLETGEGHA
ncbi:hypothetical protein [Burkholderia phage CSP3]|nr:hypothetical protein [Burkholderia phage CSP3]